MSTKPQGDLRLILNFLSLKGVRNMSIRGGDWVPQDYLTRMSMELGMHEDEIGNPEKTHRRLLRESLPYVTLELRNLALNDNDPRIRLQASSLILDRAMGKAGVNASVDELPGDQLFTELSESIEKILAEAAKPETN